MSSPAIQIRSGRIRAAGAPGRVSGLAGAALHRARLTVVPRTRTRTSHLPFVTLVSFVLLAGVVGLLMFNTSMQQAAFTATTMEQQAATLNAREQTLRMELDALRDPQRVALKAQRMGMVIPATPAFLSLTDGEVLGTPAAATRENSLRLLPRAPQKPAVLDPAPNVVTVIGEPADPGAGDGQRHHGRDKNKQRTAPHRRQPLSQEIRLMRRTSSRPAARAQARARGSLRGSPHLRLRFGFVVIAMVLSVFGARLVQLQGVDPHAYAAMAAAEGTDIVELPAERGDILDRNGKPLADSVDGAMVVANPELTRDKAPELAKFLAGRLDVDYFETLKALRLKDKQFAYIARRVPASKAEAVVDAAEDAGYDGLDTRHDPVRDYPAGDVAANLIGFMGTDEALAGFERNFNGLLAGHDGSERYSVGHGNRIPLGNATIEPAVDGQDLNTTIDLDLQWYVQRVLRQTREDARADSAFAVVLDTQTGEVLALADDPTYDARDPRSAKAKGDLVSRAMTDVYEPGSVEKVLTLSALIDAGKATDKTRVVVPSSLVSGDRVIHDWFSHDTLYMTLAGVIAQSSNIGTVLASRNFETGQLREYLTKFGLGQKTNVGIAGETQGILPDPSIWTSMTQDRIAFGQSLSVNAMQMAAAVNTIANGGVRVSPSLIRGTAVTDEGVQVGTDTATTERVVSKRAAHQMTLMMERVVDPDVGVAPSAQIPGYRVAGKTGTAQRVGPACGCYNNTFTVSFAGFAPADKPRFTVYVVVQNPRNGGGGGSVGGPAFAKIMSYALSRYGVPPTGSAPSRLPTTWRPGQVASR